eukprot:TRINITY_DN4942_c0_g1_i1.p1 TRINITY_DN4942_c0_g1~~TRINITY_DN4942_c0_g1_i1.p1  ORF type:complete len:1148 (-),score=326.50 TRINITY_DN4942_c0_g1_i1:30-3077(-)
MDADNPNRYSALAALGATEVEFASPAPKQGGNQSQSDGIHLKLQDKTMTDEELLAERKKCQHETYYPPGWVEPSGTAALAAANRKSPAKQYPFQLDPFQRVSIDCLERGESVLVSAHTSAGKTVVAQYAIAMSLRDKQRVIYTSPIKALSNQKFRDLTDEFKDVGLMTGDITINPEASCIVMTTEILRSMLYRGSELLREVGWVVFDEIHYMRDKERGVVWEETIILLPDSVKFVFLSATIPNAGEFAGWIAQIHNQPCHVVYTDFRPVPLQHYIFPAGGNGLHLVVDDKGTFREDNFQRALAQLQPAEDRKSETQDKRKDREKKSKNDIFTVIEGMRKRHYDPLIVFAFSKKACEALSGQIKDKVDFNTDEEKKMVDLIFHNAVDTLSEEDKKLPQVSNILPVLRKGIGIHHSGLLPLLKEVIEILFQEGYIKCLFATETFSIGLNMPAKTVVFTSIRKFDGQNFRWLSGGEFIQMSGRSGRRGLDDRGVVIMMVDEKMEPAVAKEIFKGAADTLISSFHIGYNMLLNLIRMEGIEPEDMLRHSFHQFQNDRNIPKLKDKLAAFETEVRDLKVGDTPEENEAIQEYYEINDQIHKLRLLMREQIFNPVHVLTYLQPGRLVHVSDAATGVEWGWGAVINWSRRAAGDSKKDKDKLQVSEHKYIVDVMLPTDPSVSGPNAAPRPLPPNAVGVEAKLQVVPVTLSLIDMISSLRVYAPKDLRSQDAMKSLWKRIEELQARHPDGLPQLDPIEDMQITDESFKKIVEKVRTLEERLHENSLWPRRKEPAVDALYGRFEKKTKLRTEIKALKKQIKKADNIIMKSELDAMRRVLRRLNFTSAENIIEVKGRVACEINAADELVLTELIFMGFFTELTHQQIAAVLACFVFDEKSDKNDVGLREELAGPLRQIQDVARRVATVEQECRLPVDVEQYVAHFKPTLMEVVFMWANGASFFEVSNSTTIFEGSIIRAMRRLEELLRQLVAAAKSIGNSELENKFALSISCIKRDIVFASSLYL